jgi:glyoxylase-like metal-dependent hydrolase (beta-lactamase superfamily II)
VLGSEDIDILLEGNEVLDVLGGLHVIPTPGHTPGSISLYAPKYKLLMVGDALNKRGNILRLPLRTVSTDVEEARLSVRKMAQMDIEVLCLGHGQPIMQNANASLQALVKRLRL